MLNLFARFVQRSIVAGSVLSTIGYAECCHFDVGTTYVMPFGYNTSGDISPISNLGDSYPVQHLTYSNGLSADITFGVNLPCCFRLDLNYQYLQTDISTASAFKGSGSDYADTSSSYAASLNINTLYVTGRYELQNVVCIGPTAMSLFIQGGLGAANQALYHQSIIFLNGGATAQVSPYNVWQFAYTAAGGLKFQLSNIWFLDLGARYMNYGSYNSGRQIADFPNAQLNAPVQAHLWTIAPFLNLSLHF